MGTGGVIGQPNRPTIDSADGRWQGYNPSSGATQGTTGWSGKSASGVYSLTDAAQQIAAGRWPVAASSVTYLGHFTTGDSNQTNAMSIRYIPQEYDDLLLYFDAISNIATGPGTDDIFEVGLNLYTSTTGTGSVIPMYISQYTVAQKPGTANFVSTQNTTYNYLGMSKAVDWTAVTGGPTVGWEGDTFRYSAFNQFHIVNYRLDNAESSVVPVCWIYGTSLQADEDAFRFSRSYGAIGPIESQAIQSLSLRPRADQSNLRIRGLLYGVKK